jgi:ACS family pantothenate transporter-like MFS transporter
MSKHIEPTVEDFDRGSNSPSQAEPKRSWKSYIWDTFDKSPEERRFLFKLDAGMLTFTCLGMSLPATHAIGEISFRWCANSTQGYFIRFLDQANLNNAFVSGMWVDSTAKCRNDSS